MAEGRKRAHILLEILDIGPNTVSLSACFCVFVGFFVCFCLFLFCLCLFYRGQGKDNAVPIQHIHAVAEVDVL
jgi:hypothetical protein